MALETGYSSIISLRPSITKMATSPTAAKVVKTPAGPTIARIAPLEEKMVMPPNMPLMPIIYEFVNTRTSRLPVFLSGLTKI